MAYSKQTWTNGDVITAEKLNHMEDGIAAGGGAVFDFRLKGTTDFQEGTYTLEAVGPSFADLEAKATNDEPIIALCTFVDPSTGFYTIFADSYFDARSGFSMQVGDFGVVYFDSEGNAGWAIDQENPPKEFTYTYNATTKEYTFTRSAGSE